MNKSSTNIDQISSWLTEIGVSDQFTAPDLESGKTVASLLHILRK